MDSQPKLTVELAFAWHLELLQIELEESLQASMSIMVNDDVDGEGWEACNELEKEALETYDKGVEELVTKFKDEYNYDFIAELAKANK